MKQYRIIPLPKLCWGVGVKNEFRDWTPVQDMSKISLNLHHIYTIPPRSFATKYDAKCWIDQEIRDEKHLQSVAEIYP